MEDLWASVPAPPRYSTLPMTQIDLFSGIGGFALAARWAGMQTLVFCEQDQFCQHVLRKHWPDVPIIGDIHDFDGAKYTGATLLTGGFPCQPYSVAGKRRGDRDDRALWPEMFRVISEARPTWVIGENVAGFTNMGLDAAITDLEIKGYEVQVFNIPACSVGAPHERKRLWIVGHSHCNRGRTKAGDSNHERRSAMEEGRASLQNKAGRISLVPNRDAELRGQSGRTNAPHTNRTRELQSEGCEPHQRGRLGNSSKDVSNTNNPRREQQRRTFSVQKGNEAVERSDWWRFEPDVGRVANGVSFRMDRIRSLGNAIVPQVAYQIIKAIVEIENET